MPSVLVYGGAGQLGAVVVLKFKSQKWNVISVDLRENKEADHSITIKGDGSKDDALKVVTRLKELKIELEAVLSVAGGFVMESIKDDSIFEHLERMLCFNLKSAVAGGYVAAHCLKQGGLLVITGANAAYNNNPTPAMLAYGVSKAGAHQLVTSLSASDSGLPHGSTVACILPIMLDTKANRDAMPDANFDNWTPLDTVAQLFYDWCTGRERPHNGAFVTIKTENKKTHFTVTNATAHA